MSGRDERRIRMVPQCPICKGEHDIEIIYPDERVAGWIILEREREENSVAVITSDDFHLDISGISASCGVCGSLPATIAAAAEEFFKQQIQVGRYLTWDAWTEM